MQLIKLFICILFFSILNSCQLRAQPFYFSTGHTAAQLSNKIAGPGISISNVSGQVYLNSNGKFDSSSISGLNFTDGVLLSTGIVSSNTLNTGASYHLSTDVGQSGDADLDNLTAPLLTEDAQVLEFDFMAGSDSVEFNFIFASEDYNEHVNNSLIDAFGFFISGPGYLPNTNLALIPGTSVPVNVNTINNGSSTGTSSGPCLNCNLFVDNVGTGAVGFSYDGYTTEITIRFAVLPCTNYHFKIAIADAGNGLYDSALIIREGSMRTFSQVSFYHNGIVANDTLYLCNGGSITLTATQSTNVNWNTGATTQSIIITQPGVYQYYIVIGSCFSFSGNITVIQSGGNIQTPVIVQNNTLLEAPNIIPSPAITWQWFLNGVPINGATQSTYTFTSNGCYTVSIYEGTCESTSNEICVTNTSLYELQAGLINIYPHPITNISVIETPFKDGSLTTLKLKDISGREVMNVCETQRTQLKLEKGSLRSGIYFLEISNSEYQGTIVRKILIQ